MKRRVVFLIAVLCALIPLSAYAHFAGQPPYTALSYTDSNQVVYYVINCESYVSLRQYPETSARRLARVPLGAQVTWLSDTINGFCHVNYNGQNGYILSMYLSWQNPASTIPRYDYESASTGENRPTGSSQLTPYRVNASSVLADKYGYYQIAHLWDGRLDTTWAESAYGNGAGEYLEFEFDLPSAQRLRGFTIWAGYQKNNDIYYKNSRPKRIYMHAGDKLYSITLDDFIGPQTVVFSDCYLGAGYNCVTLTLDTFYSGDKYSDTCISEVRFWAE